MRQLRMCAVVIVGMSLSLSSSFASGEGFEPAYQSGERYIRWERVHKIEALAAKLGQKRLICRYMRFVPHPDTVMQIKLEVRSRSYTFQSIAMQASQVIATLCPPVLLDQSSDWVPEFPQYSQLKGKFSFTEVKPDPIAAAYLSESHAVVLTGTDSSSSRKATQALSGFKCLSEPEGAARLFFDDSKSYQSYCQDNLEKLLQSGLRRCLKKAEDFFITELEGPRAAKSASAQRPAYEVHQSFCSSLFRVSGPRFTEWVAKAQGCVPSSSAFQGMDPQRDLAPFRHALRGAFGTVAAPVEAAIVSQLNRCKKSER